MRYSADEVPSWVVVGVVAINHYGKTLNILQ